MNVKHKQRNFLKYGFDDPLGSFYKNTPELGVFCESDPGGTRTLRSRLLTRLRARLAEIVTSSAPPGSHRAILQQKIPTQGWNFSL